MPSVSTGMRRPFASAYGKSVSISVACAVSSAVGQSVVAVDEQHRLRQVDAPTPTLDLFLEHGEPRGDGLQRAHKAGVVDVRTDGEASGRLLAVRVESLHPSHLALCRDEARLKQYAGQGR